MKKLASDAPRIESQQQARPAAPSESAKANKFVGSPIMTRGSAMLAAQTANMNSSGDIKKSPATGSAFARYHDTNHYVPAKRSTRPARKQQLAALGNGFNKKGYSISTEAGKTQLFSHLPVGGSTLQRAKAAAMTSCLSVDAMVSQLTGARIPTDGMVRRNLARLKTLSLDPDSESVAGNYHSNIPGVPPADVLEFFATRLVDLFGAAGIRVRSAGQEVGHDVRLMLEDQSSTPTVWLPIYLDFIPEQNKVMIHTLDGHPYRGNNEFTFMPDGDGGTVIMQRTHTQASSALTSLGNWLGAFERQHDVWEAVHGFAFTELTGFAADPHKQVEAKE